MKKRLWIFSLIFCLICGLMPGLALADSGEAGTGSSDVKIHLQVDGRACRDGDVVTAYRSAGSDAGHPVTLTAEIENNQAHYLYYLYESGREEPIFLSYDSDRFDVQINPRAAAYTFKVIAGGRVLASASLRFVLKPAMELDFQAKKLSGGRLQMKALPSGGTGKYTYQWTISGQDHPFSDRQTVTVKPPRGKTTYHVTVEDGDSTRKHEYEFSNGGSSSGGSTTASASFLRLFAKSVGSSREKLTWNRIPGAGGYEIYCARYGEKLKKVKTLRGAGSCKYTKTGLKKGGEYRYRVKAYRTVGGHKIYAAVSDVSIAIAGGANRTYTDPGSIELFVGKLTMQVGETQRVSASVGRMVKHRKLLPQSHVARCRYRTDDSRVAVVSSSGRVTAKKAGSCRIYAYAASGLAISEKITVK
ncbi:MAG: hypothetical protein ACOX41_03240 [Anaerovoracaceae bacterium]